MGSKITNEEINDIKQKTEESLKILLKEQVLIFFNF